MIDMNNQSKWIWFELNFQCRGWVVTLFIVWQKFHQLFREDGPWNDDETRSILKEQLIIKTPLQVPTKKRSNDSMKETRNWTKNKQFKIKMCFFYSEQHVSRILTSPLRIANLVECNSLLSGHYDYYIIVFCFKIKRSVSHSVSDYWPIEFCFRGATPPLCQRLCHRRASLSPSVNRSSNRPSSIRQVESSYICIL